jgi:hypothetical protein
MHKVMSYQVREYIYCKDKKSFYLQVKCGIRFSIFQAMANTSFVKASSNYFVGIDVSAILSF